MGCNIDSGGVAASASLLSLDLTMKLNSLRLRLQSVDMKQLEGFLNATHAISLQNQQKWNGRNGTFIFLTERIFLV